MAKDLEWKRSDRCDLWMAREKTETGWTLHVSDCPSLGADYSYGVPDGAVDIFIEAIQDAFSLGQVNPPDDE